MQKPVYHWDQGLNISVLFMFYCGGRGWNQCTRHLTHLPLFYLTPPPPFNAYILFYNTLSESNIRVSTGQMHFNKYVLWKNITTAAIGLHVRIFPFLVFHSTYTYGGNRLCFCNFGRESLSFSPAAIHFCDLGDVPFQLIWSVVPALFG